MTHREELVTATANHVAAGERALQRGDWQAACIAFEAALDKSATAEALEGLGRFVEMVKPPVRDTHHVVQLKIARSQGTDLVAQKTA